MHVRSKVDPIRDSREEPLVRPEFVSFLIKKEQDLVVREMLQGMSSEATNITAELSAEVRNAIDILRASRVCSHVRTVITNAVICAASCNYFQDLFTRDSGLRPAQSIWPNFLASVRLKRVGVSFFSIAIFLVNAQMCSIL